MTDSPSPSLPRHRRHNRWLVLIAAYKFALALLFVAVGVGALRMLHKDIGDQVARLAHHMRFNPESRFVDFILDKASLLNDPLLRRIGAAAFCYAALGMLEGIGLYLEKIWGEYLTLAITASFLPLELFEVFRRVTWIRASLLVINTMVFFYLLKLVVEHGRQARSPENV
ncbi:MAG TPA: DUF2127 domain-containing protein [Terracidiphilus sp.]|nr:DUF2127 domain-containing protein [Terracidiphilus sp.]